MNSEMASAAIRLYLRRSLKDSDRQKFSIGTQRTEAMEYIESEFPGVPVVEYLDEGSGDDWNRPGLERLVRDTRAGDTIVCRDKGRLCRDLVGGPTLLEELLQFRGARLFFYVSRREVRFNTVNERFMESVDDLRFEGELESNRSRTREALRRKVRDGFIAGGKCYGFKNVRTPQGTRAEVNEAEAQVILRIFEMFAGGRGFKGIARDLNGEGISGPRGLWKDGGIRSMLLNERYLGWNIHGRVVKRKVSRNQRQRVEAQSNEVIRLRVPEWQLVTEELWNTVQERFKANKQKQERDVSARSTNRTVGRPAKYALVGFSRCGSCGGSITSQRTKRGKAKTPAYGCSSNWRLGKAACPVSLQQPMDQVEAALADYLHREVLKDGVLDELLAEVRREAQARLTTQVDIAALDGQLKEERVQIQRLIQLAANTGDEMEMIGAEITARSARIRQLQATHDEASRPQGETLALIDQVEEEARSEVERLQSVLLSDPGSREVYRALFPDGLVFEPFEVNKGRRVWALSGRAQLGPLNRATPTGFEPVSPA